MTFAALLVTQKRDLRFSCGEKPIPHPTHVGSSLFTREPFRPFLWQKKLLFFHAFSEKSAPLSLLSARVFAES